VDDRVDLEPHRAELTAYCYRMLGSVHDAEDQVQETLLRAWKARDRYDPAKASLRTWLYRIATNVCLTALESRGRRPLPSGLGAPSRDTEAPLRPALDIPWLEPFPDVRFDAEARADLRLAWVAAVQELPAKQRAALVLREVLDFSAAEVADQLGTSVAAVNSALQRARVTVGGLADAGQVREAPDPEQLATIERYIHAFEAADVPALVKLLADDVVMEMPPVPLWYRGREHYGLFMERVYRLNGTGWRMIPTSANGQPALAAYAPSPGGGHHRHTLQVFSVVEGLVTANVVFADTSLFDAFGLPR
jgi:RNA polymerase sigma-70 factor, ECF subfamily